MTGRVKKQIPYDFIFDELEGSGYYVKPMFGGHAVYVGHKIVLVLYKTAKLPEDQGIWVCIPDEYTVEMKAEFPQLRGVSFFENENSAWQCLRETHDDFESLAIRFCKMIKKGDPRIGRIPKPKLKSKPKAKIKTKKKIVKKRPKTKKKSKR